MRVKSTRPDWKRGGNLDVEVRSDIEQDIYFQAHELSDGSVQHEQLIVPSLTRQESIAHQEEWPSSDDVEKPTQFFRQFETINRQRENLQHLRIRLREDRRSMKPARQRLLQATTEVLGRFQHLAERGNGYGTMIHDQVPDLAQIVSELEQMEIMYDQLEGDLIPAEYRLKESEEKLYERTLGGPTHGFVASDMYKAERQPDAPVSESDGNAHAFQDEPDAVGPGYSLQIRAHRQMVAETLTRLDAEHAYLPAEAARRSKVGAKLDEDDQHLLDSYIQSRGRLWSKLAQIDGLLEERALLQNSEHLLSGIGAEFEQIETQPILNELLQPELGFHQWRDSPHDSSHDTTEITLRLGDKDFAARENVFLQSLDSTAKSRSTAKIFPGIIFQKYQTNSESWFESVCGWLLQCAESSWASFDRFFRSRFDEESVSNYNLLRDYLYSRRPTALFIPAYRASQDLDSLNSALLSSEDITLPALDITDQRSLQSDRFSRRNNRSAPATWSSRTRRAHSRAATG
ncbi:hypothetical protein H2200_009608 [Cladophialophora chaetospira]|uniref:Uncharacterized protein n=1 Tax=Cladophialophora chaetospira TaxID=386627 RepID=A0AA38X2R5_9EURO|nr:hypothetical protein H2200_009608 [Cladophialophora chaetospira]